MKTKNYSTFKRDLAESEVGCVMAIPLMDAHFDSKFERDTLENDLLGSDITDGVYCIDVKYTDKYDDTNFILEWDVNGKKGWTIDDKKISDYVLWIDTKMIHLLDYKRIRHFCHKNELKIKMKFPVRTHYHNGVPTQYSLIPMMQLRNAIIKSWKR